MAYRKVPCEDKVKAVQECLRSKSNNFKEIAQKYGMSESTLRRECNKAIDHVGLIISAGLLDDLKKKLQTVKEKIISPMIPITSIIFGMKRICPHCGSEHIVKNGSFDALNWLLVFFASLFPTFNINPREKIQRLYCKNCDSPVTSKSQRTNTEIREAMKLLRARLICLLCYSSGLPIRKISFIMENAFAQRCSTGYITTLCRKVNKRAQEKMNLLNSCVEKTAEMLFLDR